MMLTLLNSPQKCTYAPHEMCVKRVGTCTYEIDASSVRDVTLNLYCGSVIWQLLILTSHPLLYFVIHSYFFSPFLSFPL